MNDRALALDALRPYRSKESNDFIIYSPAHTLLTSTRFWCVRNYFYLEALAKTLVKKKPKEIDIWLIIY